MCLECLPGDLGYFCLVYMLCSPWRKLSRSWLKRMKRMERLRLAVEVEVEVEVDVDV